MAKYICLTERCRESEDLLLLSFRLNQESKAFCQAPFWDHKIDALHLSGTSFEMVSYFFNHSLGSYICFYGAKSGQSRVTDEDPMFFGDFFHPPGPIRTIGANLVTM